MGQLSAEEIETWAAVLTDARREGRTRPAITTTVTLSLEDAYAIQRRVTARRLADGQRVIGWKLGYTSLAMRAQMGVDAPNYGPLTDAMLLGDGQAVSPDLLQPKVEPEIALRLGRAIGGDTTVEEVLASTADAFACLEVVDSVFTDYRFRLEDNTADGSSAAQVVVGPTLPTTDGLDALDVVLTHNGRAVASATGAAASGHPAAGVVWLAAQLAAEGRRLEAGQIVITGGLTSAVPLAPGDVVAATFGGSVTVSVRRAGP